MDEHHNLNVQQSQFKTDTKRECKQFTGQVSKNVKGGLNQRKVEVKQIKHSVHADPTNPRFAVLLFKINWINCTDGQFYGVRLTTNKGVSSYPMFSEQVIAENTPRQYIPKMCTFAGIDTDSRKITNLKN